MATLEIKSDVNMEDRPKFRHLQKVVIKYGYYRGYKGRVNSYKSIRGKICYTITSSVDGKVHQITDVPEDIIKASIF